MSARPDAMAHFREVACGVLGSEHCYPGVQRGLAFPSVVYHAVGQDALTTLDGPSQTGTAIRFETRAHGYGEAVALSAAVLAKLQRAGRTTQLLSLVDDYDEEINIHRRIRSVMVRH